MAVGTAADGAVVAGVGADVVGEADGAGAADGVAAVGVLGSDGDGAGAGASAGIPSGLGLPIGTTRGSITTLPRTSIRTRGETRLHGFLVT